MSRHIFTILYFFTLFSCSIKFDCDEVVSIVVVEGGPDSRVRNSHYGRATTCLGLEIKNNQKVGLQINLDSLIYFKNGRGEKQYLRKFFASNSEISIPPNTIDSSCLFLEVQFNLDEYEFYELLNTARFYIEIDNLEKEVCRK